MCDCKPKVDVIIRFYPGRKLGHVTLNDIVDTEDKAVEIVNSTSDEIHAKDPGRHISVGIKGPFRFCPFCGKKK